MASINGKTFIPAPMTWGQRKQVKQALTRLNLSLAHKGDDLEKATKDGDVLAQSEALAGMTLSSFEAREALLLVVYGPQGLTQADIEAEPKPSNIHNAVAEVLELSKDPEEEDAAKKAGDLILDLRKKAAA